MLKYNVKLTGGITGNIWWPAGQRGITRLSVSINQEEKRMDNPSLRDLVGSILTHRGGDFVHPELTCDTELVVTSFKITTTQTLTRQRRWPITSFPSVADYIAEGIYAHDFDGE